MSAVNHRPGAFKQLNKKHKNGRHRSKGSISDGSKGRLTVKIRSRLSQKDQNKLVRRHQANQIRLNKRHQLLDLNRSIGGQNLPVLTVVISLIEDYSANELIGLLCTCDSEASSVSISKGYINHLWCPRFKRCYQFVSPNLTNLDQLLRMVSAADIVAFLWPLNGEISDELSTVVTILAMYGLPTTLHFLPHICEINKPKVKENARILAKKLMDKWSFGNCKLLNCDNNSDGLSALRLFSEIKKKRTMLQKRHSYLVCENSEALDYTGDGLCTLKLCGYVRSLPLNVNNLLHIQGYGDFQMKQISVEEDPNAQKKNAMLVKKEIYVPDPCLQMSLVSENIPDPMDAEQTWPEKDEFPKDAFETRKITKKVPVGTSAYQAAWIVDDDENHEDDEDSSGSGSANEVCSVDGDQNVDTMDFECEQDEASTCEGKERAENDNDDNVTEAMDEDIEEMTIDQSLVEKFREERMNAQFPDEIDTPIDIPARVRFQRYRGLKSFRTSPWDPAENLPLSYARIFKFADYKRSRKAAFSSLSEENEFTVSPGSYVSILVNNVPLEAVERFSKNPGMVVYSLLPHEQRMTVVNMALKKFPGCTTPIVNKQKLLFYVGYRRFEAQPIFSQHTNGDKFKMERFMPTKGAFVASVFAPAMFPPAPVLVFREDSKGRRHLVASGNILDLNPDRIVLKRVVLSGHPFRIYRRHCVVRYMFFNREDIEWFKPIELYTMRGRRGNIVEALGTHGYMKCVFDQHLNAMDSVMLNLYKRVYPKWSYNPLVANKLYDTQAEIDEMDMKINRCYSETVNTAGNLKLSIKVSDFCCVMEKEDRAGVVELRRFAKLLNQLPVPDGTSSSRYNRRLCFVQNKEWEGGIIVSLAQSGNTIVDKCIMTLSSLVVEVKWLHDTAHSAVFPALLLYGEDVQRFLDKEGGPIRMMAELLPFLQDVSVYVSRCYEVFRNIVLQIYSFYLIRENILERVRDRKLLRIWKALGELLSILIFMDEIIQKHPVLTSHWSLLLKSVQSAQHNPSRFGAEKSQLKPLLNVIHQINAQLMTGFIFKNCCQQSFHDALYTDSRFCENLRNTLFEIYGIWEQVSIDDIADKRQLAAVVALLSFLCQTFSLVDKKLIRNVWNSHKRLAAFHIIGDIIWTPCEFLLNNIPEIEKVIDKKLALTVSSIRSLLISQQATLLAHEVSKNVYMLVEWRVKMDEELREWPKDNVHGHLMHRINLFLKGLRQADLLSRTVRLVLCGSLYEKRPLSRSVAVACIRFIEIIKEIEFLFKKWWDEVIESIQQALQHWTGQLLRLVDAVKKSAHEQAHLSKNKVDIIAALTVIEISLCGSVSLERLAVIGVALELACYTKTFHAEDRDLCTDVLIRMEALLNLQQTLSRLCDCSFLFWNRALISTYFDSLIKDNSSHIQLFFTALMDVQSMLDACRHTSANSIKEKFRDEVYSDFEKRFLAKVAEAVETDLRFSMHSYLQSVEDELLKCPLQQETYRLKNLLQLSPIYLCGQFIDIKRYTELYLERAFYNLTAVALHDCNSYREMRQLAAEKYDLHLCDSRLPFHALDQGLDVLLITRNLEAFVSNYNYNLNGQFFIENDSKNKHLNVLAVEHVANSIRTHGTGIMNTVINFGYQYLKKKFFVFSQFLYDDHIRGQLIKEVRHFQTTADQMSKMYSVKRAQRFNAAVKNLGVSDEGLSFLDKFRVLITQIGNVMGYIRIVRSGSIEATSHSLALLPDLEEMTSFSSIVSNCQHCSAETVETGKFLDQIFEETRKHVNRTNNYLQILVEVFSKELRNFEKYDHLTNFYIIIPALTVNYVEHMLTCKGTLGRRAQQSNTFTDDGFILGMAFILVTLGQLPKFDSLNWFASVQKTCKEEFSSAQSSNSSPKTSVEPSVKLRIAKLEHYRKMLMQPQLEESGNNKKLKRRSSVKFQWKRRNLL